MKERWERDQPWGRPSRGEPTNLLSTGRRLMENLCVEEGRWKGEDTAVRSCHRKNKKRGGRSEKENIDDKERNGRKIGPGKRHKEKAPTSGREGPV